MARCWRTSGLAAGLAATAACWSGSPALPETIAFDKKTLTKATSWTRGGLTGIVYVAPGETLPAAPLQVGVIISTEHKTARDLHWWIDEQFVRSGVFQAHESDSATNDACRAGADKTRTFMTLQVCKTGVARAACVEADEALDSGVFTTCLSKPGCFEDVCDQRWLARREALDLLAADFLTKR